MRGSPLVRWCLCLGLWAAGASAAEWNPMPGRAASLGPETHRLIVRFRATPANTVVEEHASRVTGRAVRFAHAEVSADDVRSLAARTGLPLARSRHIASGIHLLMLSKTLYGVDVAAALDALRRDPAVEFAVVDERRHSLSLPQVVPNDPLFQPTPNAQPPASGQWYLKAPNSSITVEGVATMDLSATNAQGAWGITTGSKALVIADVDTGILFDHPDLLRANQGGRLLPGYDFVGEDLDPNNSNPLGTYLIANDGDGWDPDPSDPGDWISAAEATTTQFSNCGGQADSSWHGTRIVGLYAAISNNGIGLTGLTWGPWALPVRALGKCGGYDSDIITGIEWAAGMAIGVPSDAGAVSATVPVNPYPADIINLSLGNGSGCPSIYQTALTDVTRLGVVVTVAGGNASGPIAAPAACSATVPGVIAVIGLRNVGTKVGYSSYGPEATIGAPAGNCINASGDCLRPLDTTFNTGLTGPDPAGMSYMNEINANAGTSSSAPIVAGIVALMRSVNANLSPAQLVARLTASATPFPPNNGVPALPVCPNSDPNTGECACPASGQCGAGMANALAAVQAALEPIGIIAPPATWGSSVVFDASASLPSCGHTIASYAWSASPAGLILSGANTAQVTVAPGNGGTLTLKVTDQDGNVDSETVTLSSSAVLSSTAPSAASGSAASACPAALAHDPSKPDAPTVAVGFSPASTNPNVTTNLNFTLANTNGFDLTYAGFSQALPAGLAVPAGSKASTTCFGTGATVGLTSGTVTLSKAIVPANGSCTVTVPVQAASVSSYTVTVAAGALTTAPAGASTTAATATLTVAKATGGGGGGALDWASIAALSGLALLAQRRRSRQ